MSDMFPNPAGPTPPSAAAEALTLRRPVLFPQEYCWFVLLAALDLMFTWVILTQPNGRELNVFANWVIENFGLPGTAAYKFALVLLVVVICEVIGRKRPFVGRGLSRIAIVVTAFPVVVGAFHLTNHILNGEISDPLMH